MNEEKQVAEVPKKKKKIFKVVIIAAGVIIALVVIAFLYMHIRMRMTEEEPEVYVESVADVLKEVAAAQVQ